MTDVAGVPLILGAAANNAAEEATVTSANAHGRSARSACV